MATSSRLGLLLVSSLWVSAIALEAGAPPSTGRAALSDARLSRLVDLFETRTLPFEVAELLESGDELDEWDKEEFFADQLEEGVYNDFFPLGVFFEPGYVGLGLVHLVTPGVAQSFEYHLELHTYRYDGAAVDKTRLGCFCRSANLRTGASLETWLRARFDQEGVVVAASASDEPGHDEERELVVVWDVSSFRVEAGGEVEREH